jgi:Na+/H+-dicarboxylate symporter
MRLSLTARIVAGLLLGIALGLFFGEHARVLESLATGYVRLMQMSVLPLLVVALISGLGRLDAAQARQLAKYGSFALLLIWSLSLALVALAPLGFPEREAGSFFSASLLEPAAKASLVEVYIPANPFESMSRSVVPAVTLFSMSIGIALIGVPGKERFLDPLDALLVALGRVTRFVVDLTPYGVVALAAVAAGTLAPDQVERLSVYFVTFILAALFMGLFVLPGLVALLTPFGYREVVGACRDAMITAFVTSNVFVVLPIIAERCSELAGRRGFDERIVRIVPAVVVPIAFNFPSAGKLLTLLFVPFAAWLSGTGLEVADYPALLLNGLLSYFAKAQVALPFLLDLLQLPADLFNLYIPTSLINGKFDSAVGAMSLFAFTLITAASLDGRLRIDLRRLAGALAGTVLLLAAVLSAARLGMDSVLGAGPNKAEALRAMHASRPAAARALVTTDAQAGLQPAGSAPLAGLRERGSLRVGYDPERLPFSFTNSKGELVGFDVEMATRLAADLGLRLELVPTPRDRIEHALDSGAIDLYPSVRYTHHWVNRLRLSIPYMDSTIGIFVRDERRHEFGSLESIAGHEGTLRIAIPGEADLFEDYVRELLGKLPYELVELPSWSAAFDGSVSFDAVVGLAEVGMAWSLVHPEFTVVIPPERVLRRPLGYALARSSEDLASVVDAWVVLERSRGAIDSSYEYWILGRGAEPRRERWSIARDVLGWFD